MARKGYIPSAEIYEGAETSRLMRERGWKYWHQLFNSRQLVMLGLFMESFSKYANIDKKIVLSALTMNKLADFNSKLCIWFTIGDKNENTFYNQALNTILIMVLEVAIQYGVRIISLVVQER